MTELFEKSIRTLELPRVLGLLAEQAVSAEAKRRALALTPETEPEGTQGTETASDGAVELGGYSLLGMLRIPEAKLELPVMSEWSYPLLAAAPCRYSGSLAGGDLVILGHSYRTHFRCLRTIQPGAAVELTDAGGETHRYTVAEVETVRESDSAALTGNWPLTLFTCTADRRHRVLVRCGNA